VSIAVGRCRRHASEQYRTASQLAAHALRHCICLPHDAHVFDSPCGLTRSPLTDKGYGNPRKYRQCRSANRVSETCQTDGVSTAEDEAVDGREQRSRRTRSAIVEAWLDLVEEGNTAPTARETADRAGIGLRTVFQHFGDMEDLHATAAILHFERIQPFLEGIDTTGEFDDRLARFVLHRQRLFERITPIRRAALHRATLGANVGVFIRNADASFANVAYSLFAKELLAVDAASGGGEASAGESRERDSQGDASAVLRQAISAAWSWSAWDYLRTSLGLSPAGAAETFTLTGHRLLGSP
jgi:AcrR family transcriptional regulator